VSDGLFYPVPAMLIISRIHSHSPKRNENDAPIYETPNPYSPGANSTVHDASDGSPVRKGLMGSLRKQKLRSISSLRSLRSPTKTKQLDTPASPPADVSVTSNCGETSTEVVFYRVLILPNTALIHRSYSTSRNHPLTNQYSISTAKILSPQA
jgi:hypothetical protein